MNLATALVHGNEIYLNNEWRWVVGGRQGFNEAAIEVPGLWGGAGCKVKLECGRIPGSITRRHFG